MCETKAVVVSISIILLVATSFCIYQAHRGNKMGHHSKIKSQSPSENEYKRYCLNGGECYYLADEDIVGCICTGYIEENDVKSACGGTELDFEIEKDEKVLTENLTRC